jgi:hypothetical protein
MLMLVVGENVAVPPPRQLDVAVAQILHGGELGVDARDVELAVVGVGERGKGSILSLDPHASGSERYDLSKRERTCGSVAEGEIDTLEVGQEGAENRPTAADHHPRVLAPARFDEAV